jgi:GNAT superfamily N-acetyltransferase
MPNKQLMIERCVPGDLIAIYEIINDAAQAYKGVIPDDRWHEPYMPLDELKAEIEDGVEFWGLRSDSKLLGIMGIQDKGEATLIRHAYVRTDFRNRGIGGKLLEQLEKTTRKQILIGTWRDASWAVSFYEKHGYAMVSDEEKNRLLKKFWNIPPRQVETSVVLTKLP